MFLKNKKKKIILVIALIIPILIISVILILIKSRSVSDPATLYPDFDKVNNNYELMKSTLTIDDYEKILKRCQKYDNSITDRGVSDKIYGEVISDMKELGFDNSSVGLLYGGENQECIGVKFVRETIVPDESKNLNYKYPYCIYAEYGICYFYNDNNDDPEQYIGSEIGWKPELSQIYKLEKVHDDLYAYIIYYGMKGW